MKPTVIISLLAVITGCWIVKGAVQNPRWTNRDMGFFKLGAAKALINQTNIKHFKTVDEFVADCWTNAVVELDKLTGQESK